MDPRPKRRKLRSFDSSSIGPEPNYVVNWCSYPTERAIGNHHSPSRLKHDHLHGNHAFPRVYEQPLRLSEELSNPDLDELQSDDLNESNLSQLCSRYISSASRVSFASAPSRPTSQHFHVRRAVQDPSSSSSYLQTSVATSKKAKPTLSPWNSTTKQSQSSTSRHATSQPASASPKPTSTAPQPTSIADSTVPLPGTSSSFTAPEVTSIASSSVPPHSTNPLPKTTSIPPSKSVHHHHHHHHSVHPQSTLPVPGILSTVSEATSITPSAIAPLHSTLLQSSFLLPAVAPSILPASVPSAATSGSAIVSIAAISPPISPQIIPSGFSASATLLPSPSSLSETTSSTSGQSASLSSTLLPTSSITTSTQVSQTTSQTSLSGTASLPLGPAPQLSSTLDHSQIHSTLVTSRIGSAPTNPTFNLLTVGHHSNNAPQASGIVYSAHNGGGVSTTSASGAVSSTGSVASGGHQKLPEGAVVGGLVGGIAGLAVVLILVLMLLRWWRTRQEVPHRRIADTSPLTALPPMSLAPPEEPRFAPFAVGSFLKRLSGAAPAYSSPAATPRSFERVSGRKLPSQWSPGMTQGPAELPGSPVPRSSASNGWYPSGSSTYPSGIAGEIPTDPFADPPEATAPAAAPLAPASLSGRETIRPGAQRRPTLNPPDLAHRSLLVAPEDDPITSARRPDLLGRSHPSMDGSRTSKFSEGV